MGHRRLPRAEDDLAPDRPVAAAAAYGVIAERPSETLARLGSARLPILLVVASETVGTEHGRHALERFRAAVPAAEIAELDSGHDLLADAPSETLVVVARFLTAAGSRRSPG